jgi:ABC-type antimicrobial peptide transport system permease subunit
MRLSQLVRRSLSYYWRNNLAVVLGVAVATAVLAGALLVGNSVRASLRNLVLERLGKTTHVVSSSTFFREKLAVAVQNDPEFKTHGFQLVCPLISLEGTVTHERSKRLASAINVYGVDQRFWDFNERSLAAPIDRAVYLSPTLANELGTSPGDAILLQLQKPSAIPLESLHSKKEELGKTLRLTTARVLESDELGEFSVQPQQTGVRAIFVSMDLLQRELEQPDKANLLLLSADQTNDAVLNQMVRRNVALEDLGIKLRSNILFLHEPKIYVDTIEDSMRPLRERSESRRTPLSEEPTIVPVEHDSKVISTPLASSVIAAADSLQIRHAAVLSYLANSIGNGEHSIPYSLVTALDDEEFKQLQQPQVSAKTDLPPIILNEWAASDLGVKPGDKLTLEYYFWQEGGRLETKTASFELIGIVPIKGLAADQNLVPEYAGITGSENLSDWDPPFPVDLQRVRPKDEDYWHQYHTTPKAFLPLSVGQSLWQTRFGKVTSIRLWLTKSSLYPFEHALHDKLDPALMGLTVLPVRSQSLAASRGATDFGEYFLYFSFFLVVSALLLTTLFFKLGIEQRVREVGLLRAIGFGPATLRRVFLIEAAIMAVAGCLLGLVGAIAYGQLMMFGLRTWWVGAVGTTSLKLYLSTQSLAIGFFAGLIAALLCVWLSLRSLTKQSTRGLLAGNISPAETKATKGTIRFRLGLVFAVLGLSLLLAAAFHLLGQAAGFFGGGTLLLIALLFFQSSWLRQPPKTSLAGHGRWPIVRLGFRNATHRPGRSVMCIALIAAAAFIVVSVDSFRHRDDDNSLAKNSGSGGFPLLAEATVPLVNDPATREGQQALNLQNDNPESPLAGVTLTRFRVRPGDDTSCLNLYQPQSPKIIAPTNDFLEANRFVFQSSVAETNGEKTNPWLLLNRELPDGVVPVIADANSLTYVLHLKLGDEIPIQNGDKETRLKVVAALSDSILQSELIMSEKNFVRLFPDQQGYRFFLIDFPDASKSLAVTAALEDRLGDYGFDVQSTSERLASFHRVENTYLSTFQMLGGLGLILGTIGLSAVLLRNVLERRRELALMRAVGYNSNHFTLMVVAENALLLFGGVMTGTLCAALAIAPVFLTRQSQPVNISLGLMLVAVLVSGLTASIAATWATVRTPLLAALKAD